MHLHVGTIDVPEFTIRFLPHKLILLSVAAMGFACGDLLDPQELALRRLAPAAGEKIVPVADGIDSQCVESASEKDWEQIQLTLENNCIACHNGDTGFDLSGPVEELDWDAIAHQIEQGLMPPTTDSMSEEDSEILLGAAAPETCADGSGDEAFELAEFKCNADDRDKHHYRDQRLLTSTEYIAAMESILRSSVYAQLLGTLSLLPEDKGLGENSAILTYDGVAGIAEIALRAAQLVVQDKTKSIGSCSDSATVSSSCVEGFISSFGAKVFRRPLSDAEASSHYLLYSRAPNSNNGFEVVVAAMLMSPEFLFHWQLGKKTIAKAGGQSFVSLNAHEIANHLAFSITGGPPDEELTNLANSDSLGSEKVRKSQAERLMATSAAKKHRLEFFNEWLEIGRYGIPSAPNAFYSGISKTNLASNAKQEAEDFFDYMLMNGHSYLDLMTSNLAMPKQGNIAQLYGTSTWDGESTPPITGHNRGLLGRAVLNFAEDSSNNIIVSGLKVLNMMCLDLPSPDGNLLIQRDKQEELDPHKFANRDVYNAITKPVACQSCHSLINPLGSALEHYDALGRYVAKQTVYASNGTVAAVHPINAKGKVELSPGRSLSFDGPEELASQMASTLEGSSCLTKEIFSFVQKRVSPQDACMLHDLREPLIGGGSLKDHYYMQVLDPRNFTRALGK